VFSHLFRAATLAKVAIAASLVAGAYGTGAMDLPETRPLTASTHAEKTHEPTESPAAATAPSVSTPAATTTTKAEPTAKPEPTVKPESTTKFKTSTKPVTDERYSFENLLRECVRRYRQHLDGAKDVCTAAIAESGLDADAFWAKYRGLFVPETKTTAPATGFAELLKECVARYARAAGNTKEACEAAIRASGLTTEEFWARYHALMVPPAKPTTTPKPVSTPKPTTSPAPLSAECMAKYAAAKAAKNGPADAFETLLRSYYESCYPRTVGTR
jgi:hypothetical protein